MKTHISLIIVASMLLGASIPYLLQSSATKTEKNDDLTDELFQLNEKVNIINNSLNQLLEKSNNSAMVVQLSSADTEQMITTNLKDMLGELIDDKLTSQSNQTDSTTYADIEAVPDIMSKIQTGTVDGEIITSKYLSSSDVQNLSPEGREQVISELVGMMNRGEIDADTFFNNN